MLAAKFTDDVHMSNKDYALIGGITLASINQLEICMLTTIKFHLTVTVGEYSEVFRSCVRYNPTKKQHTNKLGTRKRYYDDIIDNCIATW
jgi:hypothetical protein